VTKWAFSKKILWIVCIPYFVAKWPKFIAKKNWCQTLFVEKCKYFSKNCHLLVVGNVFLIFFWLKNMTFGYDSALVVLDWPLVEISGNRAGYKIFLKSKLLMKD
jgi:hypothetical protein